MKNVTVLVGENGTKDTPQYRHDCSQCVFLGNREDYDIYVCLGVGDTEVPTIIARYGSEPQHNHSGASFVTSGMFFARSSLPFERKAEAVRHFPEPRVRDPGEFANWENVAAAVFVEYVLKHRLFHLPNEVRGLRMAVEEFGRREGRMRGMIENLRGELGVAYPTAEQVIGAAIDRLGRVHDAVEHLRGAQGALVSVDVQPKDARDAAYHYVAAAIKTLDRSGVR